MAHARDDGTVGARTGGGHDDRVAARAHARGGQQCLTRWGRGGGGDWIEEKTNKPAPTYPMAGGQFS